jgi:hypothetical protein
MTLFIVENIGSEKNMATLQSIISSGSSLTFSQLKSDRALTIEIQLKLANLGFYPGGGWIDGDLGDPISHLNLSYHQPNGKVLKVSSRQWAMIPLVTSMLH